MSSPKYTLLTVEHGLSEGHASPSSSSSSASPLSPSSPSSSSSLCSRLPSRFQCIIVQIICVTLLTLAIFGFRCLTYVNPSPCYDYSRLPHYMANSSGSAVTPPPGRKRLPDAIIMGVRKCGTRALLTFLNRHPDVRAAGREIHFFDDNYHLGAEWYRQQARAP